MRLLKYWSNLMIGKGMGTNITNPIKIYFNSSRKKVANVRKNP